MLKDELEFEISPVLGDKLTALRNRYRAAGAHADNIRYGWVRKGLNTPVANLWVFASGMIP